MLYHFPNILFKLLLNFELSFSLSELFQICFCVVFTNELLSGGVHKGYYNK